MSDAFGDASSDTSSNSDFGFAPPPFRPDAALQTLQRACRDLKLTERNGGPELRGFELRGFELRGRRVLELAVDGNVIHARIARKLALTPEWDQQAVDSVAAQRKLLDEIKKRLARWQAED